MSNIKASLLDISVLHAVEDIVLQNSYAQIRREMDERGLLDDEYYDGDGDSLLDKIFQLRRQGLPFDKELGEYLHSMNGRAI